MHLATLVFKGPAVPGHTEIWAAAWKPVTGNLSYVTPMIWVDGYFKPGQDNPSIDPEPIARQSKRLPAGRRVLLWYRYFLSFWGCTADARSMPDGRTVALPWPSVAAPAIKSEWSRFLDLYRFCGGEIDYLVGDCEDWTRFLSWGLSEEQLGAIRGDSRFDVAGYGTPSLRQLTAAIALDKVLKPQESADYLGWNLQVGRFASAVMNDTIWRPAVERYPALAGSNYDGKRMLDRPAPDLNGHSQPSDNIFGTCASPVAYGVVSQASSAWFIDDTDPTRLARKGSSHLGRTPWGSFLMDVQLGRACRRGSMNEPMMPWIAPATYPGDKPGTVGYADDTRLWDEMVRQYALLGTSVFLWWNPKVVPVPGGKTIIVPDHDALAGRLDDLLKEVNSRLGGRVLRSLASEPVSFRSRHVIGGAQIGGGRYMWRISVAPGVTSLVDPSSGERIDLAPGALGAWFETATSIPPPWVPAP